jgi:putative serine protease PepD
VPVDDASNEIGDDDRDEGAGSGLPPHPLDRVWFHPSELSAFTAPAPSPRRPSRTPIAVAGAFGVLLTVAILAATGVFRDERTVQEQTRLTALSVAGNDHVAQLVSGVAPSVVSVRVSGPFGDATGSGVAMGRSQVVTSASLVAPGGAVMLSTNNGRVLGAVVVGYDLETDLALLDVQIAARDRDDSLSPARLGTADALKVGQTVVAVGMAGGNHRWASRGVVSALGRTAATPSGRLLAGLVETDIDPGDAVGGGALLDAGGSVVGILTRAAPGRALPIDVARDIADQLANGGRAQHGWLGVATVDASDRPGGGALVITVLPASPAAAAGLAVGDVIVGVSNERVTDTADLRSAVARRRPGDPVGVTVWRSTQRMHREVDLADRLFTPEITS